MCMPKPLCSRLEDLENEIHVMLTLQEPGGGCCRNIVQGASIANRSDGKVDKVTYEGAAFQTKEKGKAALTLPSSKSKKRPASSPEASGRKHRSGSRGAKDGQQGDGTHQERRSSSAGAGREVSTTETKSCICPQPCQCGQRIEAALKKCICGPKGRRSSQARKSEGQAGAQSEGQAGGQSEGQAGGHSEGQTGGQTGGQSEGQTGGQSEGQAKGRSEGQSEGQPGAQTRSGAMAEEDKKKLKESGDLIAQLKAQLEAMTGKLEATTVKLKESEQAKKSAISASNECKEKYEKLRTGKSAEAAELAKMKKEKEELSKKLEKVEEQRRNLEEQSKKNAEKEKKSLTEKVEKIESHAAKSAKNERQSNNQLATAVQQKDNHIKKLSGTIEKLADNIREKDLEIRKLQNSYKDMIENFIEAQVANKKLGDANAALVRSIKDFQEKLQLEKGIVQKLQKQITECKEESRKAFEEKERLKEKLKQLLQGPKDIREMARLREKLQEAREREQKYIDEEAYLQAKLKDMQENQDEASKKSESELDRLTREHKKLQAKFEELLRTLEFTKEEHEKKIAVMEEEFRNFSKEMQAKVDASEKRREALQADFDALTEAAKTDRQALQDIIKRTKQQDLLIKSQQDAIATKEKQLAAAQAQISDLKTQAVELNSIINNLQVSLEASEQATRELQQQAEQLNQQLQKQKELLQQKEKLIAEQKGKLQELNQVIKESETKLKRMATVEQELQKTTQEVRGAEESKQRAEIKRQENIFQPTMLDADEQISVKRKESGDGDTKRKLITSLEQKVDVLQREAALHIQLIQKQKEHAIRAAQFATTKLMETVCDFHEQVKTHKKVQYMLTKMLEEKEAELDNMCPRACVSKKSVRIKASKSSKGGQCCNPKCKNYQPN